MEEFLNKLYSYEYFEIYLIISIIVLVILFFVVLFCGKKDKKKREIEATKKLQKINEEDAFKEDNVFEKVETNNIDNKLENDTIIVPTIEDINTTYNNDSLNEVNIFSTSNNDIPEPVLPSEEPSNLDITLPVESPSSNEIVTDNNDIKIVDNFSNLVEEPKIEEKVDILNTKPIFEKVEEKPFNFDEFFDDKGVQQNETEIIKPEPIEDVDVPVFNFEEVVKEETKKEEPIIKEPQIFSSVYVPPKKEEVKEPKVEIPVPSKEELDFELPALKKVETKSEEKKIEKPILNNYNLDELSGETYTINK